MKKIFSTFLLIGFVLSVFAQVPQGINYQTIIRDTTGKLLLNQAIDVKVVIHQGSVTGPDVYVEQEKTTTNQFGLVSFVIGMGIPLLDTFANINWSTGLYFCEIQVDPTGGSNFISMGTFQLVSVPYALYAASAGNSISAPNDTITLSGTGIITITGAYPNFTINASSNAYSAGTGLMLSGNTFNALNTNPLWNANQLEGYYIADSVPQTNQVLLWSGTAWMPSNVPSGNGTGSTNTTLLFTSDGF